MAYPKMYGVMIIKAVWLMIFIMTSASASTVVGNKTGRMTLVEFYDYQCPHCQVMAPVIETLLHNNADLRVVYRPIAALNPLSREEALSVLAAHDQDKFAALHRALMSEHITREQQIFSLATALGIDVEKLKTDMQSARIQQLLMNNQQLYYSTRETRIPLIIIGGSNKVIAAHASETSYEVLQHEISSSHVSR